jgi:serine/threonine protein kinase
MTAPRRFGKYEVHRHLGSGGMASLYLARTRGIGGFEKLVAVKQLHPHLAGNREYVDLFLDEARLQARLQHGNVVQVLEVGNQGSCHYLVMEYVAGRDLGAVLREAVGRGRILRIDEIVAIAIGMCAGLHHAHEQRASDGSPVGVVHRDVSPSNLLVGFDGAIKLGDFGIAQSALRSRHTIGDCVRGKAHYMSPEQVRSQQLDRRSDLFAVGAVLYELATGQTPWGWADSDLIIMQRLTEIEIERPGARVAGLPPALEHIIMRALRRDPAERYQSAEELITDLEAMVRALRLSVSPLTVKRLMLELFPDQEKVSKSLLVTGGLTDPAPSSSDATVILSGAMALLDRPPVRRRGRSAAIAAAVAVLGVALGWGVVELTRQPGGGEAVAAPPTESAVRDIPVDRPEVTRAAATPVEVAEESDTSPIADQPAARAEKPRRAARKPVKPRRSKKVDKRPDAVWTVDSPMLPPP